MTLIEVSADSVVCFLLKQNQLDQQPQGQESPPEEYKLSGPSAE